MNGKKIIFSLLSVIILNVVDLPAVQNGNESGSGITRNLFEYTLYDRNRDRLRGRGIYGEEQEAYPNQYDYVQESNSRQATDGRRI